MANVSRTWKRISIAAISLLWLVVVLGGISALMSFHLVPAAASSELAAAPAGLRRLAAVDSEYPAAFHVLSPDCGCSRIAARALLARGVRPGWRETAVWTGEPGPLSQALAEAGFGVVYASGPGDPLAGSTVPALAVFDSAGKERYYGGYAPRLLANPAQSADAAILASVEAGESPTPYPLFGCAGDPARRGVLDPFGLKYGSRSVMP